MKKQKPSEEEIQRETEVLKQNWNARTRRDRRKRAARRLRVLIVKIWH